MEFFKKAKAIRLRSQHNKYMIAGEDEQSVKQSRTGSSKDARWFVEPVDGKPNVIRLKNAQSWNYLGASDNPFLLGMTGKHVVQATPRLKLDPSVEWEPIKEGSLVKLRSRKGTFLRANGGIPPWNNSVTHDFPSTRSSTQDWILWGVDVLEVDHEAVTVEVVKGATVGTHVEDNQGSSSLSRNSSTGSTISKADYYKDCYEDRSGSPAVSSKPLHKVKQSFSSPKDKNVEEEEEKELSRNSSVGSTTSKVKYTKHSTEEVAPNATAAKSTGPKSVRSVRRSSADQSAANQGVKVSTKATEKPKRVSPLVQHVHDESRNSSSFNKLRNVLDGIGDLLTDKEDEDDTKSDADSESFAEPKLHKPHALEVQMAKHTLQEMKNLDFETFLSSGKDKNLEQAVSVLIADTKMSARGQVPSELANLRDQIKSMQEEHGSASQDLEEYTAFSIKRSELRMELKKDAAKAHELETLEVGLDDTLTTARAKREELLKQLAEVESSIADTEKAQADNGAQIEELISLIEKKSESLREIERKEKSWQARKVEAEKTLEQVEEDWNKMQSYFQDV